MEPVDGASKPPRGGGDEMTDEPSPRPWRVEMNVVGWLSYIVDADGISVAACWRTARGDDEKERQYNETNAALIVAAVNERDRLRDIVRRLADLSENLLANYEYRYREDANSMAFVGNARNFIREARTAPGEAAP